MELRGRRCNEGEEWSGARTQRRVMQTMRLKSFTPCQRESPVPTWNNGINANA